MSGRRRADLSLYLVVGREFVREGSLTDLVLAAVAGGVTVVQLRQKEGPVAGTGLAAGSTRAFVDDARALLAVLRPRGVPLIINDRVDVALAAGADGVHVGQDDMDPRDARRLIGESRILGVSVTTVAEARAVDPAIADYAGVGPVFGTPSKADAAPPLGLEGTAAACAALAAISVPTVAIGGITIDNARDVLATGVGGLAVISAICGAPRIDEAAATLADQVRRRVRGPGAARRVS